MKLSIDYDRLNDNLSGKQDVVDNRLYGKFSDKDIIKLLHIIACRRRGLTREQITYLNTLEDILFPEEE